MDYHVSGKHLIDFRLINNKRWLTMRKISFYIVERPSDVIKDGSEFKDGSTNTYELGLAPIEVLCMFLLMLLMISLLLHVKILETIFIE